MKRNLVLALVVLASTSVFATRARIEALGEDKDGSFFIEDSRNIFLNAAHVNHIKDSVILEWGDQQDYDSATNSDAEGGFFRSHGKFTYGVYFGRQANTIQTIRSNATTGVNNFLANENNLDLYFGGDAGGIEWGAALSYSSSDKESTTQEQSAYALRLGAVMGATEVWLNSSLGNDAESGTNEFDGKIGIQAGVSHGFGHGYRAFAQYRTNGADVNAAGTLAREIDFNDIQIGIGKTTALNDNANMFTRVQYTQSSTEVTIVTPATVSETDSKSLTVVAGLEADVKEWLTVRGSVTHELWGETESGNNTDSSADSTNVAGGATVKLGDFAIDGAVGKKVFNAATGSEDFGRLSLTYNF